VYCPDVGLEISAFPFWTNLLWLFLLWLAKLAHFTFYVGKHFIEDILLLFLWLDNLAHFLLFFYASNCVRIFDNELELTCMYVFVYMFYRK